MSKPSTFARIRELNRRQQTAFNAMLLERMLPNYNLYAELTEQGDPSVLRTALDVIWQQVYDSKTKVNLELRQEKVEAEIPEETDSDSIGLYAAIDAGMALVTTLSIMQTPPQELGKEQTYVSLMSQGTIERLLIMNGEAEHSKEALEHPHMQWEIACQNEFLDSIEKIQNFDSQIVRTLKEQALEEGISNLGIEIS
ncbi:DUF416 domain-containing protein [Saccharobesus litoralis]|uniref:DUF416 domain-containing protein n=1 Tax=Saccharobesus litoralis TaxID=2172099 RepID=A0A2S0VQZ1_9ALTE|nr:YjaG family protein [Saccharobesus litoralis]AWB66638.1 DUF416 domain-containing protein [Saccharobesus litoralis]